jgi:hypothetical protein
VSARPQPLPEHALDPVEGWRTWELEREGDELRLVSPLVEAQWPSGEALAATCGRHAGHGAPADDCSCGIYAVSSPENLGTVRTGVSVVGSVALWGRVVEHEKGSRGQLAYPQRLRLVCAACFEADGVFAAPEAVFEHRGRLRALCGFHVWSVERVGPPLERSPAPRVEAELLGRYQVDVMPVEWVPRKPVAPRARRPRGASWHRDLWEFTVSATVWILLISVAAGVARTRITPLDLAPAPTGPATHVPIAAALPDPAFGKHSVRQNAAERAQTDAVVLPHVRLLCLEGELAVPLADGRTRCRAPVGVSP